MSSIKYLGLTKNIFIGFLSIATFIIVVGFIYEKISYLVSESKFSPEGEFLEIRGHKLHYMKKGTGSPTVVFDAGLGEGILSWSKIQNNVSEYASTISYDRAGIMWSERGNNPKSSKQISSDLHELLIKSKAQKPYIIVAHSLSGLTLRNFISEHNKDILGVVFVDVSHPDQMNRFPKETSSLFNKTPAWLISFASSIGIVRLFFNPIYPNTKENDPINIKVKALRPKSISAAVEELQSFNSIANKAANITTFGNTPLVIITGASPERYKYLKNEMLEKQFYNIWSELQQDLLKLSSDSKQILAKKSGHIVQMEQPEIIIKSIKKIILKYKIQHQNEH